MTRRKHLDLSMTLKCLLILPPHNDHRVHLFVGCWSASNPHHAHHASLWSYVFLRIWGCQAVQSSDRAFLFESLSLSFFLVWVYLRSTKTQRDSKWNGFSSLQIPRWISNTLSSFSCPSQEGRRRHDQRGAVYGAATVGTSQEPS